MWCKVKQHGEISAYFLITNFFLCISVVTLSNLAYQRDFKQQSFLDHLHIHKMIIAKSLD